MYIFILTICALILTLLIKRLKQYEAIDTLPGPNWFEVLNLFVSQKGSVDVLDYLLKLSEKYGPVVKIWLKPFRPVILVSHPRYFEEILGSKDHLDKTAMYRLLHDLTGNGLVTNLNVRLWKSDRKLLNNVFSNSAVSHYALKFRNYTNNLRTTLNSYENKPVDVYRIIQQCTLHIVLGYLTHEEISEETAIRFSRAVDRYLELFLIRLYSPYKTIDSIFRFTKEYKDWKESCGVINGLVTDILKLEEQRRKNNIKAKDKRNFMDLILESGLPRGSIFAHLKTFILAGFDTTATTTSFALFEIAKKPEVQENILREYLAITATNGVSYVSYADLQDMTYTESVIKEVMRLYPAVPLIGRSLKSPMHIDGFTIPKDTDVIFSILGLHRSQFSNPKGFDPERFSPENVHNVDVHAYAPFSVGARDCIGKKIAMVEVKFIVSYIVRHFTLHPVVPEHKLNIAGEFAMRSKNGVPIIFKKRK